MAVEHQRKEPRRRTVKTADFEALLVELASAGSAVCSRRERRTRPPPRRHPWARARGRSRCEGREERELFFFFFFCVVVAVLLTLAVKEASFLARGDRMMMHPKEHTGGGGGSERGRTHVY